ncbi:SRPBCC domain-containing protein [Leptospira biflexa]|uniref:SRPBCC family protein n=1 Tax=Leptospira biflexa TaxID=172 RepID=UPI001090EAAD|nr:SRPBCC family protein [Leptospira biflexa]TGM47393.1 SRPBCC domain-containing protein [Leptospira biflexa]TGM50141.1 SRPBCC domain-containing protein [Leptospira biflexa]
MNSNQDLNHKLKIDLNISIESSLDQVWNVLVSPDSIKEYLYGTETTSDWKKGSEIWFRGQWEGKDYEDKGIILKFDIQKEFSYTYFSSFFMLPDLPKNYSEIVMKLNEKQGGVFLHISQIGFLSESQQNHSLENWKQILEKIKQLAEQSSE